MESFRKAYGALKDSTMVGLAKVNNSQFKDLDIAIVKATNHVQSPPKERHVRKIFSSVLVSCPRADVGYCIYALSRRLGKTRSWIVAVKTLIVFHRILREGDPTFREQLMHFSRRGHVFRISNFKDDSSTLAWDCTTWVRAYALFLEERLECFRTLHFNTEAEKVAKSAHKASKVKSKINLSNTKQLLEHLPTLQQLLYRLLCCQPEGIAARNFLIQYAFSLVVKESFKVYCAINDGIVNLVDKYFEMPKHEAAKALDIYKRAGRQADQLADFYSFCKTLDLAHAFHFPTLRQPPPSFLATMEDYIKGAPSAENKMKTDEPQKPEEPEEEVKEVEIEKAIVVPQDLMDVTAEEPDDAKKVDSKPVPAEEPADLLDLRELSPDAKQIEESNALALAIIQPGNDSISTNALTDIGKVSGWELALVTQPSAMSKPQAVEVKMAGGFDKLLLDSLYEDEASRRQLEMQRAGFNANYAYETTPQNPFNPFDMPNIVAPQTNMYMAMIQYPQQQQQPNMIMTVPYNPYTVAVHQNPQPQIWSSTNPFADPFGYYPPAAMPMPHNGNYTLL